MKRIVCIFFSAMLVICCILPVYASTNGNTTVYITDTGECYHRGSCNYLNKSKHAITLEDAVNSGYRACSKCSPPKLTYTADKPANQLTNQPEKQPHADTVQQSQARKEDDTSWVVYAIICVPVLFVFAPVIAAISKSIDKKQEKKESSFDNNKSGKPRLPR